MKSNLAALCAGLIFGLGLTISQMINPSKVLGFLDITGNWDPSLIFVMGGALITTFIGYKFVLKSPKPMLADRFRLPTRKDIDGRLVGGAALFGIGWGLIGLCPGPALAGLALGGLQSWTFVVAMIAGVGLSKLLERGPA